MSSHSAPKTCRFRTLARGPVARVDLCTDCGTLSIHLGMMTFRLDAPACESLLTTLGAALKEHRRAQDEALDLPTPSTLGRPRGLA